MPLAQVVGGLLEGDLAGQDGAGGVVVAPADRGLRLGVERRGLLGQPGELDLDALAAGGDVGDSAAHLLQVAQLGAVCLVEPVGERLDVLAALPARAEDLRDPASDSHGVSLRRARVG